MTTINSLMNKIIKFVKKKKVYLTIFYTFAYSWYGVYFLALTRISENAYEYLEEITFFYKNQVMRKNVLNKIKLESLSLQKPGIR